MIINGKQTRALTMVPAGVVEVFDSEEKENLLDSTVSVRYTMHPNIQFLCKHWGIKRLNNATWRGPVAKNRLPALFRQLQAVTRNVVPEELIGGTARSGEPRMLDAGSRRKTDEWLEQFEDIPTDWKDGENPYGGSAMVQHALREQIYLRSHTSRERDFKEGVIAVRLTRSKKQGFVSVWIKARTSVDMGAANILNVKTPDRVSGTIIPAYKFPTFMKECHNLRIPTYNDTDWEAIETKLSEKLLLVTAPAKPGLVDVWVGRNYRGFQGMRRRKLRQTLNITGRQTLSVQERGRITLKELTKAGVGNDNVVYEDSLADAFEMTLAEPYELESLDANQQRVAGVHLATRKGFVNAAETGDGKTVTTLAAFEHKAESDWLGLVICEAVVKGQWVDEAAIWFPQLEVFVLNSRKELDALREFVGTREGPTMIVTSYSLAGDAWVDEEEGEELSETGEFLTSLRYSDICVDEGLCLRKNSKTHNALKALRDRAEVGVVLTATPYNTSKNDFARLISFARNDYELFQGVDLDAEYDLNDPEKLEEWTQIMYPYVQRDTVVDVSQFPTSDSEVIYLNPTIEELELSAAITNSLQDILEDMIVASERAAKTDKADTEYQQIAEELKTLRGTAVGSVTLARQAASDPECIMESDTIGGELIRSTSILDAVTEPTKRKKALELVKLHVEAGDQIIVFTEFRSAGQKLFDILQDKGYRVGSIFGGGGVAREGTIAAFQNQELDVVIATGAAKRGLNLHSANVMIHYDLSYTPEVLLQRCGRIIRRNSRHNKVKFYYLVLNGTIDSRVMGVVAARTAEALITSDAVSSTEMNLSRTALSVQSMLTQVDTSRIEIQSGGDKTIALVKSLLSV